MILENYLLAITAGFLSSEHERIEGLLTYFRPIVAMDELVKSGAVSITGSSIDGIPLTFDKWIARLRAKGIRKVRVGMQPSSGHRLPAHMRAGLVGGRASLIDVQTDSGSFIYALDTVLRTRHFRERLQDGTEWVLGENEEQWQRYQFRELPAQAESGFFSGHRPALKDRFEAVLTEAYDFSVRTSSPFADTFRLALLLSAKSSSALEVELDNTALRKEFSASGLSEGGLSLLDTVFPIIGAFAQFDWGASRIYALAAVAVADVFGCLGSWNDQSFDARDHEIFKEVSARLFAHFNNYFSSLLSVP
jgi:hypothetical protein